MEFIQQQVAEFEVERQRQIRRRIRLAEGHLGALGQLDVVGLIALFEQHPQLARGKAQQLHQRLDRTPLRITEPALRQRADFPQRIDHAGLLAQLLQQFQHPRFFIFVVCREALRHGDGLAHLAGIGQRHCSQTMPLCNRAMFRHGKMFRLMQRQHLRLLAARMQIVGGEHRQFHPLLLLR